MAVYGDQFGFAAEVTPGTGVTPDHFLPILPGSESMEFNPTWGNSDALVAGAYGQPVSRSKIVKYDAAGSLAVELAYSKLGLILKQLTGSAAAATLVSGSVYKQIHQIGTTDGKALTAQVGRNEVSTGTIKPFTYPSSKITQAVISVSDGDTGAAQLALTLDAVNESTATALAVASYASGAAAGAFAFGDVVAVKLGGTAATTSGVIAITGGAQATSVLHSLGLTITSPGATGRFFLGGAGTKKEQINAGQPMITGTMSGEFTLQSEIYDLYKAQTTVPLQITFQGALITGALYYLFDIVLPAVKITKAPPHISGYDPTTLSVDFQAFRDDVAGNNMCQITYQNTDSAL